MNIERDLAITLRVTPFSNTSSVLTWFSARQGRMATLAKGAQRSRSLFLGQADLFYTCEILYYPGHAHRKLAILKECAPLKPRVYFRNHWRAMLCASYATLLMNRICPQHAPHPSLFRLLDEFLDALATGANRCSLVFWFELRVLSEMGLAPNLNHCARCRTAIRHTARKSFFSASAGGLVCAACRSRAYPPDGQPIQPGALALLALWQNSSDPIRASRAVARAPQIQPLGAMLGKFLHHHLDALYPGRELALRY